MSRGWQLAGAEVRAIRRRRWRTIADFAKATDIGVRTIGDVERGSRSNFTDDTLDPIEDALGLERGSIRARAEGSGPLRFVPDPHLARVQAAWVNLSMDAREMVANLVEGKAYRPGD